MTDGERKKVRKDEHKIELVKRIGGGCEGTIGGWRNEWERVKEEEWRKGRMT